MGAFVNTSNLFIKRSNVPSFSAAKIRHFLACGLGISVVILSGCTGSSGGTARVPVNINSYGFLLPGIVADKVSYPVESLQSNLTPNFLAPTFASTGLCATLTVNALCGSNILATSQIAQIPANSFIVGNTAGVRSTKFYRIMYNTPGAPFTYAAGATTPQNVSALIIMPQDASGNPLTKDKIKGVILYYHPTISSKAGVPSGFDATNVVDLFNTLYTDLMLAGIYASQGYVVVAPDYVGQGANPQVMHPYVGFATTNALSGIYALKAARMAATANPGITLPDSTNLYITSYSEGGPYALWASKLITQGGYGSILTSSGFNLRRTVGISGAYDLSNATSNFMDQNVDNSWDSKVNIWNVSPGMFSTEEQYPLLRSLSYVNLAGGKSLFSSYLITALTYYVTSQAPFGVITNPSFTAMNSCVNIGTYIVPPPGGTTNPAQNTVSCSNLIQGPKLNLPQLFNTAGVNTTQIFTQVFGSALTTGYMVGTNTFNQLVTAMQTPAASNNGNGGGNNEIKPFINKGIAFDPSVKPYLQQQDIASGWTPSSPLELIYLKYDSSVTNVNSLEACGLVPSFSGSIKAAAPNMVNCTQVNNAVDPATGRPGLYQQFGAAPIFLDHGWAEPELQMVALSKILANP